MSSRARKCRKVTRCSRLPTWSHVWVQAKIYEDQVDRICLGQEVEAIGESFPGEVLKGNVAFIDPPLDPTTRTVNVRYDLPNPEGRLRPGMYVTVTLKTPVADTPAFLIALCGELDLRSPRYGTPA